MRACHFSYVQLLIDAASHFLTGEWKVDSGNNARHQLHHAVSDARSVPLPDFGAGILALAGKRSGYSISDCVLQCLIRNIQSTVLSRESRSRGWRLQCNDQNAIPTRVPNLVLAGIIRDGYQESWHESASLVAVRRDTH